MPYLDSVRDLCSLGLAVRVGCTIGAVLARHPRTVRVYVRLPARPRASRGVIVRGGGRGACLHSGKRDAGLCDLIFPYRYLCVSDVSAQRG